MVLLVTILPALCSLVVFKPKMLCIMIGMDHRTVWVGFAGDDTTRAVFPFVVFKPKMLGILAV